MTLARGVDKAFTALAEDVAAEQCQGLGQFGVFFLQLIIVGRSLIEHAFELINAALGVFGLALDVFSLFSSVFGLSLGTLGLLPQLVIAAEQVVEQPLEIGPIVGEVRYDAHDMNYIRSFMSCKCLFADFSPFFDSQPAR